ncbi:MAG: helix-turn-helix transcriptional regulator [Treponema sp.]|nr:helix-turn-helix transcriptional regulator [Treponema sp.]
MDSFFDDFRMNIKYYRDLRGLNQSELAIQADSSNGMIGNIESGKAYPSFKNALAIARALKVHPADLFLRDASKSKEEIRTVLKEKIEKEINNIIDEHL